MSNILTSSQALEELCSTRPLDNSHDAKNSIIEGTLYTSISASVLYTIINNDMPTTVVVTGSAASAGGVGYGLYRLIKGAVSLGSHALPKLEDQGVFYVNKSFTDKPTVLDMLRGNKVVPYGETRDDGEYLFINGLHVTDISLIKSNVDSNYLKRHNRTGERVEMHYTCDSMPIESASTGRDWQFRGKMDDNNFFTIIDGKQKDRFSRYVRKDVYLIGKPIHYGMFDMVECGEALTR